MSFDQKNSLTEGDIETDVHTQEYKLKKKDIFWKDFFLKAVSTDYDCTDEDQVEAESHKLSLCE